MKLKRQLVKAFLLIAGVPLMAFMIYLLIANGRLASELYTQNLLDSIQIQTDYLDEKINTFMLESKKLASSKELQKYLELPNVEAENIVDNQELYTKITEYTTKTLESVELFCITDEKGKILYHTGSKQDADSLAKQLVGKEIPNQQTVFELEDATSLVIITPIKNRLEENAKGMFAAVYKNDYFLKEISNHEQIATSNSFIYCTEHRNLVQSKQEIEDTLADFSNKVTAGSGTITCKIDGERTLLCYKSIAKTPWILVNSMPMSQVSYFLRSYGMISMLLFIFCIIIIWILSKAMSGRILAPLEILLKNVEVFFVSGTKSLPSMKINQRTEIGYLADKFVHLAGDIAATQDQLKESNYLYEAILHASYDIRISLNLEQNEIQINSKEMREWFESIQNMTAIEKTIYFFEQNQAREHTRTPDTVRAMIEGKTNTPTETEVCCNFRKRNEEWFRVLAVPVIKETGEIRKIVLHFQNITDRKLEELQLLQSSQRDPLCGLLNKQALLELEKQHIGGKYSCNAVFFIDLDNFKKVNDKLGHAVGDRVLIEAAKRIKEQFCSTDLISRYGGDEFVVFAPGMTYETAQEKAQNLVMILEILAEEAGEKVQVTASVGVVLSSYPQESERLIQQADSAMYRAKERGKSQYYMEKG